MRPHIPQAARVLTLLAASALLVAGLAGQAQAQDDPASVSITDQSSGGIHVTVDEASLPDGGFVVIHDSTLLDGQVLKSVRGTSGYLLPGAHTDIRVHLTDPLEDDATLVAMLHKDTDGDRTYRFIQTGEDGPYTDGGGAVTDTAEVTHSAWIDFSDQPTDGRWIVVDGVEMAEGGFVAVHDERLDSGQALESVIGVSGFLEAGAHHDVRIELDEEISTDQDLVPMPHQDSDGDRSYDFITSGGSEDGPYVHDGGAVVDRATVSPTSTAGVTLEDQSTGGIRVVVKDALLPAGGFVTVHDGTLAQSALASVRGTSGYLGPGLHRHIEVRLDAPLLQGQDAFAMPHRDTDGDRSYDFVTSGGTQDGPYTDMGAAVTDEASIHVSASVEAQEQVSNGDKVTVPVVDLADGGFIAVHDARLAAGEVIPSVIGVSAYLEAGLHQDVEITLDEVVTETREILPMPHRDTDGDQTYDFVTSGGEEDGPYVDGDGAAVLDQATLLVPGAISFTQQTARGEVTVDLASLPDGGFVTIHDDGLLEGDAVGSVAGVSAVLDPGLHEDVTVSIDRVPSGSQVLIAMLHHDTDDDGDYDFVTSGGSDDGPYVGDGIIMDDAQVAVQEGSAGAEGADGQVTDASEGTPGPGAAALILALGVIVWARRR